MCLKSASCAKRLKLEKPGGYNCGQIEEKEGIKTPWEEIAIDYAGEWYPSATYGGMAGDNWWRTGKNNNGGVQPYMVGKGYFSLTTSSRATMGSFMYWTNRSHVALVTYTDYNGTIKYSQHSDTTQSPVYYVYSNTKWVEFYAPNV